MNDRESITPVAGVWWDDAELGRTWISEGRTVTEGDVTNFAGLSGDFHALHTDAEAAADSQFGQRIAHGALVLSIVTGLRSRLGIFDGTLIAFAELRSWRFRAPVFIGDTIHCVTEIVARRETSKPDRGVLVQHVATLNQRGEVVQEGDFVSLVRRRLA